MASTRTFAARFCSFDAPEHWTGLGNVGLIDEQAEAPRGSAAVNEVWIHPPRPLAELAAEHRKLILAEHPKAELMAEGPFQSQRFAVAHRSLYTLPTPDGAMLLHKVLVAHGPLVCALITTVPASSEPAAEVEAAIVDSFTVPAASWAEEIRHEPLALPQAAYPVSATPLPRLGVAIPVPTGWTLDEQDARLRSGDAEIAFVLHGRARGGADRLFATSLDTLQQSEGWRATAWARGELGGKRTTWMLDSAHVTPRSWGPATKTLQRQVFVEDEGVLELRLTAPDAACEAGGALLEVVAGLRPLPAEDRRLAIERPWLAATLEGAWTEEAPGFFVRSGSSRLAVMVTELPRHEEVAIAARRSVDSLTRAAQGAVVTRQKLLDGLWQEHEVVHFALDWRPGSEQPEALRSAWIDGNDRILWLLARGSDAAETDALFTSLLERTCVEPLPEGQRE